MKLSEINVGMRVKHESLPDDCSRLVTAITEDFIVLGGSECKKSELCITHSKFCNNYELDTWSAKISKFQVLYLFNNEEYRIAKGRFSSKEDFYSVLGSNSDLFKFISLLVPETGVEL